MNYNFLLFNIVNKTYSLWSIIFNIQLAIALFFFLYFYFILNK